MSVIQERSYSEFSLLVHGQVTPKRIPANGTIEVTRRCPLTCSHCYNNLPMNDPEARAGELTFEEHCRILDELADLGCLWMLFTGGEIFARRDFMDIYEHARRRGFLVTLFTNATMITEQIADRLAALPPFEMEVTLYGRTEETYEALTGVPGSWRQAMRGIELILERKIPLKLKTVAVKVNVHELDAMREFAESKGVEFKFDPMINPRIDCSSAPLETRLSPAEIVALDLADEVRVDEWRKLATECAPAPPEPGETAQVYGCGGGINSFAIDPYGALTICVLSHVDSYDLRSGSVTDGWEHFLRGVRMRPASRVTKCTACGLHSLCGSCPANSELETGDPEEPVDFLCRTAHLRAAAFDIEVPPHGECEYCVGGTSRHVIDQLAGEVEILRQSPPAYSAQLPLIRGSCSSGGCSGCSVGVQNQGI